MVVLAWLTSARLQAEAPPPQGLSLPATVLRNYDGDTVTVEVKLVVNVRLTGSGKYRQCWAPELIEPGGKESKINLEKASKGKHGTLLVPIGDASNLSQMFTLGRVLGDFWVDDTNESLSEHQIRTGHASSKKGGKLGE